MLGVGMSPALLETALMVADCAALTKPELMPVKPTDCLLLFSLMVMLPRGFNVGA